MLIPPARVDDYEIRSVLERGTHTVSYRAEHPSHGAVVLCQLVPVEYNSTDLVPTGTPEAQARAKAHTRDDFARAAQDLCTVRHPHLTESLAYLDKGETGFLVIRDVPGPSLASTLDHPQPLAALEAPLGGVLAALEHLHTGGRVHGNVTPDTIVLGERGRTVLAGHGALERLGLDTVRRDVESGLAAYHTSLTFPRIDRDYVPPELWRGEPPDATADLYAIGAVLYRAVTRMVPPDALRRVRTIAGGQPDPYVPVAKAAAQPLPPEAAAAIDRALALSRLERIDSIAALRAGLGWKAERDPFEANVAWLLSWLTAARWKAAARSPAWRMGVAALLVAVAVLAPILGLTGFIGWTVSADQIVFEGPEGGPFQPASASVTLARRVFVRPIEQLFFPSHRILQIEAPDWLRAVANREAGGEVVQLSLAPGARAMAAGEHSTTVGARFPWGRSNWLVTWVTLRVSPAEPARSLSAAEPASPRPAPAPGTDRALSGSVAARPERVPAPARGERPSRNVELACDEGGGLRFDQDRPADGPFLEDTGSLTLQGLNEAIDQCTAAARRQGANRRFSTQLGRLLAERAVRRARTGEGTLAEADLTQAVTAWREADRRGSAYAANLIGAYHSGTYNRLARQDFVAADQAEAVRAWRRSMERGNPVGQRNYASQLLSGNGIAADVRTALSLLQDAARRGDDRAASILGVAFYTGYPAGVVKDQAEGWRLLKRAPCDATDARTLIRNEIARNRQSAAGMPSC